MRKTNKASPAARSSKKGSNKPLKVRSLSDLRELQRQASDMAAPPPAPKAPRRPHRFLPPRIDSATPSRHDADKAGSDKSLNLRPDHTPARITETAQPRPDSVTPEHSRSVASGNTTSTASDSGLSQEDIALFRRVVQSVTPSPKNDRLVLQPIPAGTPGQLKQRRQQAMGRDATPALDVSDQYASGLLEHDDTVFLQAGQGPHLIKGLKKGKWPVQASLDLHGSTLDDARDRLDRFIQSCRDHEIRCVRIVHGKGYGSKDGSPVLKETVRRWLSQLAVVQAYIESDEANGGAGAVLVLLSKANSR